MVAVIAKARRRPEIAIQTVEDLLRDVRAGRVRVPSRDDEPALQPPTIVTLLDSVSRGYPIGPLLLWSRSGTAGHVDVGGRGFDVPEQPSSWVVVDGRRRLTALVSALMGGAARSTPTEYYFDLARAEVVHALPAVATATLVPLDRVVEAESLFAWLDENRDLLLPAHKSLVLRLGRSIRDYEVVVHRVDDDERVVREIFERLSGTVEPSETEAWFQALKRPIAHVATPWSLPLHERDHPTRVREGIAGSDGSSDRILDADADALLDRVLVFLREDAGILDGRIPSGNALNVISALMLFFKLFSAPSERARRLLTRWLWRGIATGKLPQDEEGIALVAHALRGSPNEEVAAARMLAEFSARPVRYQLDDRFDLAGTGSRLHALALLRLKPLDVRTGQPLTVSLHGDDFIEVVREPLSATITAALNDTPSPFSSIGNRVFHPSGSTFSVLDALLVSPALHVLASHAISEEALAALRAGDAVKFIATRRRRVEDLTAQMIDSHAEWEHSDRPSIAALSDEEE